jgi:hypothetical protein
VQPVAYIVALARFMTDVVENHCAETAGGQTHKAVQRWGRVLPAHLWRVRCGSITRSPTLGQVPSAQATGVGYDVRTVHVIRGYVEAQSETVFCALSGRSHGLGYG